MKLVKFDQVVTAESNPVPVFVNPEHIILVRTSMEPSWSVLRMVGNPAASFHEITVVGTTEAVVKALGV